jgi:hypothetical protein
MSRTALLWGVKASFSEYILRLPDGRFSATDGAELLLPLTFAFEIADGDHLPDEESVPSEGDVRRFRGDARFAGHSGALFLRIANPWLHFNADGGFVSIVGGQSEDDPERRPIASFSSAAVAGTHGRFDISQVLLDAQGVDLFNRTYPAETPLDPLRVGDLRD